MRERPFDENSMSSCARDSGVTPAVDVTTPFAGLRNFASSRRTTGTIPSAEPKCLSRNSPLDVRKCQLSTCVDHAEMIEIVLARWKLQQPRRLGGRLNA